MVGAPFPLVKIIVYFASYYHDCQLVSVCKDTDISQNSKGFEYEFSQNSDVLRLYFHKIPRLFSAYFHKIPESEAVLLACCGVFAAVLYGHGRNLA